MGHLRDVLLICGNISALKHEEFGVLLPPPLPPSAKDSRGGCPLCPPVPALLCQTGIPSEEFELTASTQQVHMKPHV